MSWWDDYLAPGDVRARRRHAPASLATAKAPPPALPPRIDAAQRVRRQNALLYGGLGFSILSLVVTRRSLRRKRIAAATAANNPTTASQVDGGLEAVEALGLASLNVFSFAMAAVGVAMTWFDIADVEDMRETVRRSAGYDVYGGDSEADRELEVWIADVLSKNDGVRGLQHGVAEKLLELKQKDEEGK